jgi:hypothetical protein
VSRVGAHAGRLHPSEQLVFAMVFALMAGFVVVITMSALRSQVNSLLAGRATAAGSQTDAAGSGGTMLRADGTSAGNPAIQPASPQLDALLATAIGPVRSAHPGRLAVGVIDETTGQQARYAATQRFSSGSIVTTDILAALLVGHEHAGTQLTSEQADLATAMEHGSAAAAAALWQQIGRGNGLASANRLLKLTQTIPGAGNQLDQTRTTVADQLQLLIDLSSSHSPLTAAGRAFLVRVLGDHGPAPRWGASAAGASNLAQGGWLPDGTLWVTNSLGIVEHAGHVLLVVVLSSGSTSQAAGASLASAAAVAATNVMVQAGH